MRSREYMRVDDARSLEDYLARFDVTLVGDADGGGARAHRVRAVDRRGRDGVRYIEVRYAPVLNTREGLSLERCGRSAAARTRARRARRRRDGARDHLRAASSVARRLDASWRGWRWRTSIAASSASISPAVSWAIRRRLHAAAFAYAREHDLACTCHAGEGADASSVREAVHVCGAHRIGHATRLIEDESLTQYVNDRRIALEICLTSNVQTHAVESYEEHPLRQYFDRGMNVVLNTDNRLMSGTTLTDEYMHAASHARTSRSTSCARSRSMDSRARSFRGRSASD